VSQQSAAWVSLNNVKCHPDTQLFLCSLFSPVCLERYRWDIFSLLGDGLLSWGWVAMWGWVAKLRIGGCVRDGWLRWGRVAKVGMGGLVVMGG
jgi:hypothetical protein